MNGDPRATPLAIPSGYGTPIRLLAWEDVAARLAAARHYWLATVRPDGRPHVVPVDGLWIDDRWYFGGSAKAVKHRNLLANPQVTVHLDDGAAAVIVEGTCAITVPTDEMADHLSATSKEKYGHGPPPSVYRSGVWEMTPVRVMAWTDLPADVTRFEFA